MASAVLFPQLTGPSKTICFLTFGAEKQMFSLRLEQRSRKERKGEKRDHFHHIGPGEFNQNMTLDILQVILPLKNFKTSFYYKSKFYWQLEYWEFNSSFFHQYCHYCIITRTHLYQQKATLEDPQYFWNYHGDLKNSASRAMSYALTLQTPSQFLMANPLAVPHSTFLC